MIDTFLIKLTQFEKTGSIGKCFIPLGDLKIKFQFQNQKTITFFVTFTLLLFDEGVLLPFNKGNELNLKRKQVKQRKSEIAPEESLRLFLKKKPKKNIGTYIKSELFSSTLRKP